MAIQYIDEDFVAVYDRPGKGAKRRVTLVFGDAVELGADRSGWTELTVHGYFDGGFQAWTKGRPAVRDQGVLKLSMVDVQQGDGIVLETPGGKIVLIDGGDNKLFARHVAARFLHRRSTAEAPLEIDAILVTHGDADHFQGLTEIRASESLQGEYERKRLFIHPKRVFHNGLVKGPASSGGRRVPEQNLFGRTLPDGKDRLVVDLYDDPRDAPSSRRNRPFQLWCETLDHWEKRGRIVCRRVAHGMDPAQLFDFLVEEGIGVEIQGPFERSIHDPSTGKQVPALPFLHEPRKSSTMHVEEDGPTSSLSASHTVNGHSIALRLTYGDVRFALTGDLNQESMEAQRSRLSPAELEAEIVKAPHHGSHDFDFETLLDHRPVVALVSSGDENAAKEYIHPRATLMAALGKAMRGDTGVVFCTELAAFFHIRDYSYRRADLVAYFGERKGETFTGEELRALFAKPDPKSKLKSFYAFERTNFGIVHVRTDGRRVLVLTHSGKEHTNEAYAFDVRPRGGEHEVRFRKRLRTR